MIGHGMGLEGDKKKEKSLSGLRQLLTRGSQFSILINRKKSMPSLYPWVKGHETFISLVRELFTPLSVVQVVLSCSIKCVFCFGSVDRGFRRLKSFF